MSDVRYELSIRRTRFGWGGNYTAYHRMAFGPEAGEWNPLGSEPLLGWWRPSRSWLVKVLRRKVEKDRAWWSQIENEERIAL